MKKMKLWAGRLLILLLMTLTSLTPADAYAAAKTVKASQPISIEADELYFSDKTGEMFARGNVIISQDQKQIFADLMRGNEHQAEVWVDGTFKFQEPLTQLQGMKLTYNYSSKFGVMQEVAGKCGDVYLSGRKAEFTEGKYTLYDSTATTCKMKGTPDYRITARKVEIWPGEQIIAHQAKIWVKNTVLYATPRYQKSLKTEQDDAFPRFGFQNRDGIYIAQRLAYPLSDTISVYADLAFYSKAGFRPTFGLLAQESAYTMQLVSGFFRDDNDNWVRKEPEFHFALKPRRIGKSPLRYKANLIFGLWRDSDKESWHQDFNVYVNHDPIHFDRLKTWTLNLGAGVGYVHESYDNSDRTPFRYNVKLSKKLSPMVTA